MRSGKAEHTPYSLSRWTDLPASKWEWFRATLAAGSFRGFTPESALPYKWSLAPEDTLALVFWTKDPTNLIKDRALLAPYRVQVQHTITGWHEVEKGAPGIEEAGELLWQSAEAFGADNVVWRFSPVPLLAADEVLARFEHIAEWAGAARVSKVYVSFLQENDKIPETRSREDKLDLLARMARVAPWLQVLLCNEDRTLYHVSELPPNLGAGVCAPPEAYGLPSSGVGASEGCGCLWMADPFTINEACVLGCKYCYAADHSLSDKKRNNTRKLPVLP